MFQTFFVPLLDKLQNLFSVDRQKLKLQRDKMVNRLLGRYIVLDYFYAPNFEEDEEAYWFGPFCVCVHPWVTLCIQSRMVRDRILKFDMWN